jgi:hypothetical protein
VADLSFMEARRLGVHVARLAGYHTDLDTGGPGLVIGYGEAREHQIAEGVARLAAAYRATRTADAIAGHRPDEPKAGKAGAPRPAPHLLPEPGTRWAARIGPLGWSGLPRRPGRSAAVAGPRVLEITGLGCLCPTSACVAAGLAGVAGVPGHGRG